MPDNMWWKLYCRQSRPRYSKIAPRSSNSTPPGGSNGTISVFTKRNHKIVIIKIYLNLLCKRTRCYHRVNKTQITERNFIPFHASVIYQIPWIHSIVLGKTSSSKVDLLYCLKYDIIFGLNSSHKLCLYYFKIYLRMVKIFPQIWN